VCPFSRDLRRQIRYNARSPARFALFLTGSVMLGVLYGVGYLSSIVERKCAHETASFETNHKPTTPGRNSRNRSNA